MLKIFESLNYVLPKNLFLFGLIFVLFATSAVKTKAQTVTGGLLVKSIMENATAPVSQAAEKNRGVNFISALQPTSDVVAGGLDPTFAAGVSANDGYTVSDVLIQPDGKHLVIFDGADRVNAVNGRGRNGIARLNPDGSVDDSFDVGIGFNNVIYAMALQPDGKIIVGGGFSNFTGVNGLTNRLRIARLNPDGSLDSSFGTATNGPDGSVRAIVIRSDGKILIAGSFSNVSGTPRQGVALLNADGSLDPSLNSSSGINSGGVVLATAIQPDGKIVIGGSFISYGGTSRVGIARVNQDGTLDTSFNVGTGTTSGGNTVATVALQSSGKILIGGDFSLYNNATAVNVARLNTDGSHDTTFVEGGVCTTNPCTNRNLFAGITHISVQSDDTIYMSAKGSQENGTGFIIRYLARFNTNGVRDGSFSPPSINCACTSLPAIRHAVQSDGKVFTNVFRNLSGQSNGVGTSISRFNTNGARDVTYNPIVWQTGGIFDAVIQAGGKVIVVGSFLAANAELRNYIARFNPDGTVDPAFTASTDGIIRKILLQPDGKILIAGEFNRVNSTTANQARIARLNADGTLDTSFQGLASDTVNTVALQSDGKILIGGRFTQYAGTTTNRIARLNANGSLDTTFNVGTGFNEQTFPDPGVRSIAVQPNGQIVVGGDFSSYNGTSRQRIARLNSNGTLDSGFNPGTGANGLIEAINILPTGKILIGGDMTTYNSLPRVRIARLNADGSLDTTFSNTAQPTGRVNEIYVQSDGRIIIGGVFSTIAGQTRNGIARLLADGGLDTTFHNNMLGADPSTGYAGIFDTALAVDEVSGRLYYGGRFSTFNNVGRSSLARIFLNSSTSRRSPFDFDGDNKTDLSIFRPAPGEWWYSRSSDGGNRAFQFGTSSDRLVPADFTGDGKTDIAFWRPSTGRWFVLRSEDFSYYENQFGTNGDTPAPADYDGDGRADAAVFRPSDLTWYIQKSSGGTTIQQFGAPGDAPVPSDYDGDGKADIAIFRPNAANGAQWWIQRSSNNSVLAFQFGAATDKAVQADYTGDGKTDVAFWRPSTGIWYVLRSEDFSYYENQFGTSGDLPVAGDYDGDGRTDAAVFRPSNATWFVQRSTAGTLIQQFGLTTDKPVPNVFVP